MVTGREADYRRSVVDRRWISAKQAAVLARIIGKVEAFARATREC
jgi:hypothetical protein